MPLNQHKFITFFRFMQGWTNTNMYRANTGVRSCSPEHERTRTRIFQKLLNTNEHELGKIINYRTRTNTNEHEHLTQSGRTANTWSNTEHEYWIRNKYHIWRVTRVYRICVRRICVRPCSTTWKNCSHSSLFRLRMKSPADLRCSPKCIREIKTVHTVRCSRCSTYSRC